MKHQIVLRIATLTALLAPANLVAQDADAILAALVDADTPPTTLSAALKGAKEFLTHQPTAMVERDAFAESLVAIAAADPDGEVTHRIVRIFHSAGLAGQSGGHAPYEGAFSSLEQIYTVGADIMSQLLGLDMERGIEVGLRRLESREWGRDGNLSGDGVLLPARGHVERRLDPAPRWPVGVHALPPCQRRCCGA